jgi:AcrR family transcriptional regulator
MLEASARGAEAVVRSDAHRPLHRLGRPRSERSRQAILTATLELLGEQGFRSLSMEAIAQRAGVGKSTIYRWWSGKAELVSEAVDAEASERVLTPDLGDIRSDARALISSFVSLVCSPLGRVMLALEAEAGGDEALRSALQVRFLDARERTGRVVLERAARRGEVRADVDADLVMDVVMAVVMFRARTAPDGLDEQFVDALVTLIVDGVARSGPRSGPLASDEPMR